MLGRRFTVRTDHQALVWLFKLKEPKGRIARWLEILSYFNFSVQYRPGHKHANADALSRCENPADCTCPETDNLEYLKCGPCNKCQKRSFEMCSSFLKKSNEEQDPCVQTSGHSLETCNLDKQEQSQQIRAVTTRHQTNKDKEGCTTFWTKYSRNQLQKEQLNDPSIGPVYDCLKNQTRPDRAELVMQMPAIRHYWHIFDALQIRDGLLLKEFHKKDNSGSYLQFVTPKKLRKEVITLAHDNLLSGHLGRKKTQDKVSRNFFWFEMREDIAIHVAG